MMASHPPWPPDYHWVYPDCTLAALPHQRTENKLKEHESFMSSPREGRKVIFIAWDLAHLTDCCCLCSPPQFYDGNHQVIRRSLESAEIMSLALWRLCSLSSVLEHVKLVKPTLSGIRRRVSQQRYSVAAWSFLWKSGKKPQSHQYDSLSVCRSQQQTDVTNCVWISPMHS